MSIGTIKSWSETADGGRACVIRPDSYDHWGLVRSNWVGTIFMGREVLTMIGELTDLTEQHWAKDRTVIETMVSIINETLAHAHEIERVKLEEDWSMKHNKQIHISWMLDADNTFFTELDLHSHWMAQKRNEEE